MSRVHRQPWHALIKLLRRADISFAEGLTDSEIMEIEAEHDFRFPPDLKSFLQTALPVGDRFPNWRDHKSSVLEEILGWPLHGLLFDVEYTDFWLTEWGARPAELDEAKRIATRAYEQAPRLIPIFAHRYIPDSPPEAGNPVISVWQTDIIHYGFDLDDYWRHEFKLSGRRHWPSQIKPVVFWDVDRWQSIRWD